MASSSSAADVPTGYGAALASREFRALFAGQLVSIAGSSAAALALTVLVYRESGSPFLASLAFALAFLPYLVGGGLLSSLVDRVAPRRLVAGCDAASAVLAGTMAVAGLPVGALLALMFGIGTLGSVAGGARNGLVRQTVVPDAYVPARSLFRIASQLAQIGGNAVGGVLVAVISARGALLLNAGTFVWSAAAIRLFVADHPTYGEAAGGLLRDSLHGARAIFSLGDARRLMLASWLGPMFWVAPEALAAPYVAGHGGSPKLVGLWLVALPVGVIAGDVTAVRRLRPSTQRRLMWPLLLGTLALYPLFALDLPIGAAIALLVASGVCGAYALGLDARVRDAVPLERFARTMALNSAGLITLQGIGFALAGAIGEAMRPADAIALEGAAGLVLLVPLVRGDVRRRAARAPGPRARRRA